MPTLPDQPDPAGALTAPKRGRPLQAAFDAIFKEDDRIGGRAVTRLTADLPDNDTSGMLVLSTIGFGEHVDREIDPGQAGNARLLVGGELITASTRRSRYPFQFTTLARGVSGTTPTAHPAGTLVFDVSGNVSALDLLRRGLLVDTALGDDLHVIARNLGLHQCPGMTQEQLRSVIKGVAYLPKQPLDAFRQALTALLGAGNFTVTERTSTTPFTVYVEIVVPLATDIRGRFILNGGEQAKTTGLTTLSTLYPPMGPSPSGVLGVYLHTKLAMRGFRSGMTNYYAGGGSYVGHTITLAASPGPAGTQVIVDYAQHQAHSLSGAPINPLGPLLTQRGFGISSTERQPVSQSVPWAYLSDPLLAARCLLNQIRAAGIRVVFSTRSP